MGTAIKHHVQDRIKQSFVIFDIRALWSADVKYRCPTAQSDSLYLLSVAQNVHENTGVMVLSRQWILLVLVQHDVVDVSSMIAVDIGDVGANMTSQSARWRRCFHVVRLVEVNETWQHTSRLGPWQRPWPCVKTALRPASALVLVLTFWSCFHHWSITSMEDRYGLVPRI